jgi:hypothetical protein
MRFHVPSDTYGQPPYLVDLASFNGNGKCTCIDYDTRKRIALRDGEPMGLATRCKHIRRGRVYLLDKIIQEYITRQRESNKNPRLHAPYNEDEGDRGQ